MSVELELDVVAGKGFCFQEGFGLLLGFCLKKDVLLALGWEHVNVCSSCYMLDALCDFKDRLLGYVKPYICVISKEVGACRVNFDGLVIGDCVCVYVLCVCVLVGIVIVYVVYVIVLCMMEND